MIQFLNRTRKGKAILILSLTMLFLVGWAWTAGAIFVECNGVNTKTTPLTIYQYWYHYGKDETIRLWLIGSLIMGLVVAALPFVIILTPRKKALFGEARWASEQDIRKVGLYGNDGIIVGVKQGFPGFSQKYLVFGGSEHVLMAAPTRSGKGVSVVVPNLLNWEDSVVVLDIKQENWDITAGFRAAHGQKCILLNFAARDYRSHHWNPLFYISEDTNFRINDIQKIGQMLFPRIESEAPIWQASARSLWLGIVLYLIETDDLPVTMGEVLRQITMGDDRLSVILEQRQESAAPLSRECFLSLKEYLDTPERTRGSVRKGTTSALELFYNPMIDATTAANDFDLRDLRKNRMSIYVGISPDDLERLAPLINLFFQQVIDLNTRELPEQNPALKYQCLMLMDEFTSMGKVGILSKGLPYLAGYGLRMLLVIQSPAQLRELYGIHETETFLDNLALHIIFAPKNIKVAKEISETMGTQTVKNKSNTKQQFLFPLFKDPNKSINTSEHSRALLLPQELLQMNKEAEILLMGNAPPVLCKKVTWYSNSTFKAKGNGRDGVKWISPKIPLINPLNTPKGEVAFSSQTNSVENNTVERPITAADLENIDNLNLENFSCDFSEIEIPEGEINEGAMDDLVEQFFTQIEEGSNPQR